MSNNSNQKKTVLVTGGAGFIGSNLVDELLLRGNKVIAIDNLRNGSEKNIEEALLNPAFKFIKADILDLPKMIEISKGVDLIYHLACLGVRHSLHSPLENHEVNASGTLNMLEAARISKVPRFFYISTSEVYGEAKTFPLDENTTTYPTTVYGSSKLAGENYTMSYSHFGLDVTIFRIFNNFGPRSHYEGDAGEIIPRSIVKLLYNQRPVLFGNGMITRDFFYVKDTARVLADFLENKSIRNELINIGTGKEITMKEIIEKIVSIINPDLSIDFMPSRPADVPRLWVNSDKFKNMTGYKPAYSIENGLEETILYFKKLMEKENLIDNLQTINWKK